MYEIFHWEDGSGPPLATNPSTTAQTIRRSTSSNFGISFRTYLVLCIVFVFVVVCRRFFVRFLYATPFFACSMHQYYCASDPRGRTKKKAASTGGVIHNGSKHNIVHQNVAFFHTEQYIEEC